MQWATGEVDEDHMAAVAFNLMAYEYVKWKLDEGIGRTITAADMNTHVRDSVAEEKGYYRCNVHLRCGDPSKCLWSVWVSQERNPASDGDV
jgi:hypothetical protein